MKRPMCEDDAKGIDMGLASRIVSEAIPQEMSVRRFEAHVKRCQLQSFTFDYYMHGLVEEAGEVFEVVRAVPSGGVLRHTGIENVLSEIGDVLWYSTSLSLEIGGDLAMPQMWPIGKPESESEVLMMIAVARLAGRVKESMRGDKPLQQFVPAMAQLRDEVLACCAEVTANHGAILQQSAMKNVRKLSDRFERSAVRGDGDSR